MTRNDNRKRSEGNKRDEKQIRHKFERESEEKTAQIHNEKKKFFKIEMSKK